MIHAFQLKVLNLIFVFLSVVSTLCLNIDLFNQKYQIVHVDVDEAASDRFYTIVGIAQ